MPSSHLSPGKKSRIPSFEKPCNIAVIGARGGIGQSLLKCLSDDLNKPKLIAFNRGEIVSSDSKNLCKRLELENEDSIKEAANFIREEVGCLNGVFVATGLLHDGVEIQPEKSWKMLDSYAMEKLYRVNAVGPALIAKHFLPLLDVTSKSVFAFLSARVGSITDNNLGGWYSYRASKAALNMILKSLSIELRRKNQYAICVGLHPGTVDTPLSKPFMGKVSREKAFSPEQAAGNLLSVVDRLTSSDSGKIFAYDGSIIPY